ncbi:MAG TPA: bile acid beta-glucosidase [Synechococcales cyanobacterium M55_K2018_004]|nr:bile acid beta-glucosidase [Synechococcales cyanobacterium M55_K2018_004]
MTEFTPASTVTPQIPSCAWKRPLGLGWEKPYTVRYASNLDDGPWHGAPLGGFGAGCIGRSHRGDFNLWHIDGGEHVFATIPACQFSVFEAAADEKRVYVLCTDALDGKNHRAWDFYPKTVRQPGQVIDAAGLETGEYAALYPRSWFTYRHVFQAELTCEQFSPIWAHNYQETSYPVAVFLWTAHNPTETPLTLSIMLTWQNVVGWFTNALKSPTVKVRDDGSPVYEYQPRWGDSTGNYNRFVVDGDRIGCVLERDPEARAKLLQQPFDPDQVTLAEGDGQWAIATQQAPGVEVSHYSRWSAGGDGAELWRSFADDGRLPNWSDESPATHGEQIGCAIAVRFTLAPGETRHVPFTLAWDFPITEFAEGVTYWRRYTDFFGRDGKNAWAIATHALEHYEAWQTHIQQWQHPILERQDLPDWFKMALFNELYDLTAGATLWSAATARDPLGQFAVVECLDYRWYESLDVRLYGSFALVLLFPELDKAVLRAFARAIPSEDPTRRKIGYYFTQGVESPLVPRKVRNATPHDLGAPNEHPWEKTNYTSYQDCNLWKDLGSDFVLQVYRDFVLTGRRDVNFLAECWDAVVAALNYLKAFDYDGDGIPENSGAPDQTFDDWRLQGISAYCGGLWIAALEAAIAMAKVLSADASSASLPHPPQALLPTWQTWLSQARSVYHPTLWNGRYYRLDSGSGSDVVMADQLCGQFYARLLGLPDVVPPECAIATLKTIYESCFLKFGEWIAQRQHAGAHANPVLIGAANGVRPDGSPLNPNDTHPLEVWTGINFGLAALMVQMGLKNEALFMTEAVVKQIYEHGLQFRTPEAITAAHTFRASYYLRAMAIWGIYGALTGWQAAATEKCATA